MCVSTVFSGSLAGKPTVVDEDQGYGKRYGNSNGIGPPAVYLRGGAANHAENVRARALTQSKNTVKNSDHKSIVEVSIRSFPPTVSTCDRKRWKRWKPLILKPQR